MCEGVGNTKHGHMDGTAQGRGKLVAHAEQRCGLGGHFDQAVQAQAVTFPT